MLQSPTEGVTNLTKRGFNLFKGMILCASINIQTRIRDDTCRVNIEHFPLLRSIFYIIHYLWLAGFLVVELNVAGWVSDGWDVFHQLGAFVPLISDSSYRTTPNEILYFKEQ